MDGLSNPAVAGPPRIVHADAQLVVADKPAGLLCVPGRGPGKQECLAAQVQAAYPDALVVHRLDMATSGLCVFARGAPAQRQLSMAFAARHVRKRYEAVVAGELAPADGWREIDLPLRVDWPRRPRQVVDPVNGKPSLTRYRVLGPGPRPGTTRLALEPVTGRSHQLRVHLLAIGHPIVGDTLYAAEAPGAPRLLLHAAELGLAHPATGQPMHWTSPVPF